MPNNHLCRLQFIPNGKNLHAVTSHRGLKIIDTKEQRVISGFNSDDHSSNHWSDWHPNDLNLLANCNELSLDLIDRRQNGLIPALELATYSKSNCSSSYMDDGFASSCLWSPRNDNHLIVGNCDGSIVTYDNRNSGRIENGKVDGYFLSDFQMTPNEKYLFGWCRSNNTLYQWEYENGSFKQHIDEYDVDRKPNVKSYPDFMHRNLRYHVTDSHLYWPAFTEYGSLGAVVGLTSDQDGSKLYLFNNSMELVIWSVSAHPEQETPLTIPGILIDMDKSQKFAT